MAEDLKLVYHGAGYVGITGACHFGRAGIAVLIYDPDQAVVDAVNEGKPKAGEFLGYLAADFPKNVSATSNFELACRFSNIHIFAVPTERAGVPFDDLVVSHVRTVRGQAVQPTLIIESTLTPGTVDRYLLGGQLYGKPGEDYFLAVCPRRDWFASREKCVENIPRIVGGVTLRCTARAVEILSKVSREILTTDYRTAEIVKAFENCMLHVPVMLAHQLACAMPDRDIAQALQLVTTHWRFKSLNPLYLNAGTGGRCVSLGSRYLAKCAGPEFTLGREAIDFDEKMRSIVAQALFARWPPPARVCVLGIAYRPNFRDAGLSPGLDVAKALEGFGYEVGVCDPMWSDAELLEQFHVKPGSPSLADILVLATPHAQFEAIIPRSGQLVFDAQGAWAKRDLTCEYVQVGTPGWRG